MVRADWSSGSITKPEGGCSSGRIAVFSWDEHVNVGALRFHLCRAKRKLYRNTDLGYV